MSPQLRIVLILENSVLILQGQYEFCYKTVLEFLVSFDTYANFK